MKRYYYLHVDVIVAEQNATSFEQAMDQFVREGAFLRFGQQHDIELVVALKSENPFPYRKFQGFQSHVVSLESGKPLPSYRYVHLWYIPDQDDLDIAALMRRSPDDDLYVRINSLVERETQNLVWRVGWLSGPPQIVPSAGDRFVRVMRSFRSRNLSEYLFKAGALIPLLELRNWHSLGHYQNVTGPLNTVTELWQTKNGTEERASMREALQQPSATFEKTFVNPYLDELPMAEIRERLVLAPYALAARRGAA